MRGVRPCDRADHPCLLTCARVIVCVYLSLSLFLSSPVFVIVVVVSFEVRMPSYANTLAFVSGRRHALPCFALLCGVWRCEMQEEVHG